MEVEAEKRIQVEKERDNLILINSAHQTKINWLQGKLLLFWFAMGNAQIILNQQKIQSKKEVRTKELGIKALRSRLNVYKTEAEGKLCAQRLRFNNEIEQLKKEMKIATDQKKRHLEIALKNKSSFHLQSNEFETQILHLHQKIQDLIFAKSQSENREKLALREMTDKEEETDRLKDKLDWCLQRLRVSEWRRTEIEHSFGSLSRPSVNLEKAMLTVRNRRNSVEEISKNRSIIITENDSIEREIQNEQDEHDEQDEQDEHGEHGEHGEQDNHNGNLGVTLDSPIQNLKRIQKSSWKSDVLSNSNSLTALTTSTNRNTKKQRPSTSLGNRRNITDTMNTNRTRSTSAHPMRRLSSSGTFMAVPKKKSWVSPFLAKKRTTNGKNGKYGKNGKKNTRLQSAPNLRRPQSGAMTSITSIHERLHMSNSMLDWKEHTAFQSYHIAVLVIASDQNEQALLHQCLNAAGVGVAVCSSLKSASKLLKRNSNATETDYHVVIVSESLKNNSTALDVLHMIMHGAVQDAHAALETHTRNSQFVPETIQDKESVTRLATAFNYLKSVPEVIVLGKPLGMGDSVHRQKFKHTSAGAFKYVPHPICKGDVLSAVDAAIAKRVVHPSHEANNLTNRASTLFLD